MGNKLDDMLDILPTHCKDYVFVMGLNTLIELGNDYKGKPIRRMNFVEGDKMYLMPDPIYNATNNSLT